MEKKCIKRFPIFSSLHNSQKSKEVSKNINTIDEKLQFFYTKPTVCSSQHTIEYHEVGILIVAIYSKWDFETFALAAEEPSTLKLEKPKVVKMKCANIR